MVDEPIALLDACVLVQAPLRDTLLRLAEAPSLYRPVWSDMITGEMTRVLQRRFGLVAEKTDYLERELRRHFPEAWIAGFEPLIEKLTNDPKDRHVLGAAIQAGATTIVTYNKRDFPPASAAVWGIEAIGPAAFLESLYRRAPATVVDRLGEQALNLGRSLEEQLIVLAKAVPTFVEVVRGGLATGPSRPTP